MPRTTRKESATTPTTDDARAEGQIRKGEAAEERGAPAEAMAAYDRALALRPRASIRAHALVCRGSLKDELEDYDGALADFDEAVSLDPADPFPRYLRGMVHQAREDWRAALEEYDAAIERDDERAEFYEVRGEVLFNRGRWARARADWARVVALDPDHDPKWHFYSGEAAMHLEKYAEAIADFTKTIEAEPEQPKPILERAKALEALGKHAEALRDIERVMKLVPGDPILERHRKRLRARVDPSKPKRSSGRRAGS